MSPTPPCSGFPGRAVLGMKGRSGVRLASSPFSAADEVGPNVEEVVDEEPGSVLRGGAAEEAVVRGEVAPPPTHELRAG